jgi:hypothetical protein
MELKMEFKDEDILVCKPGYNQLDGNWRNECSGGNGYEDGMMAKCNRSSDNIQDENKKVYWDFRNGYGVFAQALRIATEQEKEAYNCGIRNINNIKYNVFKISYISITNEIKKHISTAHTESEAISEIKDLKSVNYIMSEK